ncbi:PREDICTED: THAP domain-containing protein 8 isoform X1 [Colobus angolensis palliatus]|uniref:THAP domain-containing protein 8 isoform X1 n=1 Tax=Colobus angolensis palliatus TaxID=336983 RepID=UPI0005F41F6D|nr:PREDICTED: THAP domain-containing protein 8 isoform X1 [Colobus angolensis palliatus]
MSPHGRHVRQAASARAGWGSAALRENQSAAADPAKLNGAGQPCLSTAGRQTAPTLRAAWAQTTALFPLKDGPRLQAWLRHMGREHWVPNCHQHLCSEHFTPSCFQWRWGVRYLRPDAVPSIFSRAPPAKSQQRTRHTQKPVSPPPPLQENTPLPQGSAITVSGPVRLVVLDPTSGSPETAATVLLTPLAPAATPEGSQPEVPAQQARTGLGSVLGALQRRVRRLQRCQERHQAQLQALERLAQQLHGESLLAQACRGLQRLTMAQTLGPEESQTFTIICGGPDVAVVLAQGPAPATVDAKPELLDTRTPST